MIGYFGEIFYVIAVIQAYMFTNGGILLLFVSISLIHQAFSKMFLHSLNELNEMDNNRLRRKFTCKLIRFRSCVKESVDCNLNEHKELLFQCLNCFSFRWFFDTADIYSLIILIHTICSMLFLTCIIFQLDLVSNKV